MCRASGNKKDTTLVDGGASTSPEELGREFLDYILRGGWIDHVDIAGQCDNTISVRNGPVGCKVRWRGVCMVNETLDMVDE